MNVDWWFDSSISKSFSTVICNWSFEVTIHDSVTHFQILKTEHIAVITLLFQYGGCLIIVPKLTKSDVNGPVNCESIWESTLFLLSMFAHWIVACFSHSVMLHGAESTHTIYSVIVNCMQHISTRNCRNNVHLSWCHFGCILVLLLGFMLANALPLAWFIMLRA